MQVKEKKRAHENTAMLKFKQTKNRKKAISYEVL